MTTQRWTTSVGLGLALAVIPAVIPAAHAGGMFISARGARGLGMAGSLTASDDDGSALYQNPAGLADIHGGADGVGLLLDAGLVLQRVGYSRVDSGGNPQPHVNGDINVLPIPTFAISWKLPSEPRLTLAAGVWTPYIGINSFPADGPQRYSDVTLNGSVLAVAELAAGFRVNDHLAIGLGLQDMIVDFRSRVALSACSQLNCAPEDPGFDALTELRTHSYFTPSAIAGATYTADNLRIGLAVQLPFWVRTSGSSHSRLPTDPMFVNAQQVGDQVDLDFDLPLEVRLGLATHLAPNLAIELGFDYEAWSMQKDLSIDAHNIQIQGIPGIGSYTFNKIAIARDLDDTYSVHVGGEWEAVPHRLILRAGYMLETSATPDRTASVLTPDGLHNLVTAGFGVPVGALRIDVGYGHEFTSQRTVTDSASLQLNPIQPSLAVPVGNGKYTVATDIVSAGLAAQF